MNKCEWVCCFPCLLCWHFCDYCCIIYCYKKLHVEGPIKRPRDPIKLIENLKKEERIVKRGEEKHARIKG